MNTIVTPNPFDNGKLITMANIAKRGNWKFITNKSDFPTAIAGVITLKPNTTYIICGDIDLLGDRLVTSGLATIVGGSSETSFLKSTGLGIGTPFITSEWTLAMQFVSFSDVDTLFNIDGTTNPPLALDWTGVNFNNIPNLGTLNNVDNFVYTKGAFLSSKGLVFEGSHGTIAFNTSLIQGDGSPGNIIEITATANVSRRFRINQCAVVAFGATTALNVSTSSTIPSEGYILFNNSFTGGSTYVTGLMNTDNEARWEGNRGIQNTASIGNYYMRNNAVATVINTSGVAEKVEGTTIPSSISQGFSFTDNRATYVNSLSRPFKVEAIGSLISGNNQVLGLYVYHWDDSAGTGTLITESEIYTTTSGSGKAEAIPIHCFLELETNDYIEIWVENSTSTSNVTAEILNTIITPL